MSDMESHFSTRFLMNLAGLPATTDQGARLTCAPRPRPLRGDKHSQANPYVVHPDHV